MIEYLIIGSGPGGAPIGYHLAKNGADCLILEAGEHLTKDTFPKTEAKASAQLYWGGGIEFNKTAKMAFLRAKVVGGTSIVNQCLLDRFDDIAWNDWKADSGVDYFNKEQMTPYYEKVEELVDLYTFKPEERNGNAQLFTETCDKLGYGWKYLTRGQNNCGYDQGNDCIGCLGGCQRDSKQSTLATYIQKGIKDYGLKIQANTYVERIEHKGDHTVVYAVSNGKQETFKAKNLILAGGSFGTTELLYKSGFKDKFPALGKYFSSHPQFMSFGLQEEPVMAHKGYFQTAASHDDNFRAQGFKLENVYAPPISTAMLFGFTGKDHQNAMKKYPYYNCMEVAIRDENVGEIKVTKKGKLVVEKPLTKQDEERRDKGLKVIDNILKASGAKEIIASPFYFGLHLMGGCVMGIDEKKSVVAPDFKLHGYDNIYVADSSLFPNAPGINPSLTIMALSEKLNEQLN